MNAVAPPAYAMNPRKFFLGRDGQTLGPYSNAQLRLFLAEGRIAAADLVWWEGESEWQPIAQVLPDLDTNYATVGVSRSQPAEPTSPGVAYHHVSPVKFAILSVVTLGIYELFWFYRSWKYVRQRDQSGIGPFWRALFSPIWCYALARDIGTQTDRLTPTRAGIVAASYVALVLASRLPDPWWLVSFGTFLPLLGMVSAINSINQQRGARSTHYARFGAGPIVASLFGVPFVAWSVVISLNILPSTQVIAGRDLPAGQRNYLRAEQIVDDSEQIEHFYSTGILSIKDDGNLVTDQRIISYWRDPDSRALVVESARYEDIKDFHLERGDTFTDSTMTVVNQDGSEFILLLSTEADGDQRCLDAAETMWRRKREHAHEHPWRN